LREFGSGEARALREYDAEKLAPHLGCGYEPEEAAEL
jgi:hypothetical protein